MKFKTWTVAEAKKDFERGLLVHARIERGVLDPRWSVVLRGNFQTGGEGPLIDAHLKEIRVFSTADAAVRVIESIGFAVGELSIQSFKNDVVNSALMSAI